MHRRLVIKNLLAVSGGIISLPSWASEWSPGELTHASSFTPTEQQLLASVADAIIPAGDTIGAVSVGVDKFLQKLLDDCYEKDVCENVKKQLLALDATARSQYSRSFVSCDQTQRETMLLKLSSSHDTAEKSFFNLLKNETIRGFNTSKEVMTKYLKYQVAPGRYYGCVPVKN